MKLTENQLAEARVVIERQCRTLGLREKQEALTLAEILTDAISRFSKQGDSVAVGTLLTGFFAQL